jgi:mRNA interferase MazF
MISTDWRHYESGDLLLVGLDPTRGSEQSGIRPALVISSLVMHEVSKRIIICPITRNMVPWPTKVALPATCQTRGMVLCDQVRTLDVEKRFIRMIERASPEVVTLVRSYVGRLLELEVRQS